MKIRFFDKGTGETHIYSRDLCVNSEGQVINLKKNWTGLAHFPGPAGPNIGWEIIDEETK